MDNQTLISFLIMVFGAVFLLTQFIVVPTFGTKSRESKLLRKQMGAMVGHSRLEDKKLLIRGKYLRQLSPVEKWLESLPGMQHCEHFIERSGHEFAAYRLVLACIIMAVLGGAIAWAMSRQWMLTLITTVLMGWVPIMKLKSDMNRRFAKFEEQLPEALDIMTQSLRAGYPFNETLHIIATEMENPIAKEFGTTYDELNYGVDMAWSLRSMVDRTPSLALTAIVTTVLVQKETGGNLAESFEGTARLIRSRFRFHRRVRTFTAETRLSSWVLALVPFALYALMSISNPEQAQLMLRDPLGINMIIASLILLIIGNYWIRKLIDLDI